ncbi:MAG: hypothetical protein KatS3mg024_1511 [Armatimonadota bacterium]|nr:MAG: hypothetical protein KatS3mg024_1511 [Armatimonadota bacterium]
MMRHLDLVSIFTMALLCAAVCAAAWPTNYLSAKLGASVSTDAQLEKGSDPGALLSDGPISKGGFHFAQVDQEQVFLVDLGQERVFDRVEFGSVGYNEPRNAKQLVISISNTGPEGPFQTVYERQKVGHFQVIRLPECRARWIRFDLGAGSEGAQVHSVRIYKGHTVPPLPEVMQLLSERIQPGLPGLENYDAAVRAQDWSRAARELRAYFAKRLKPANPPDPNADLSAAEEYANGPRGEKIPIDWSYQETRDWYEYKNFLNRGRMLAYPLMAFYNTGQPRWRDHFRAVFYDWLSANPCPPETIYADAPTWRTLDSAMRLGWLREGFPLITAATGLEDEVWANYLYALWEHGNYLSHDTISGGNWLSTITSHVMDLALDIPEFKDQKAWLQFGKNGFEKNVLRDVHPDGKEMEDAPGYICMAYAGMLSTLKALDAAGIAVEAEVLRRMDRVQDFLGAITQPSGIMPAIGDCRGTHPYILPESMEYFRRQDIRYILSKGREGSRPERASVCFPDGAWAVMRSPYDAPGEPFEDARHLVFKASHASHGHRDYLSFTLYAYGRPLLIDPGIKSYERGDGARYVQTAYHNTVCVDGQNQPPRWGSIDRWVSSDGMDFLVSTYKGYESVDHRRSIVFVKPDYWVVNDTLTGPGNHTCDQNWHFNEDAGLEEDPATKLVRTTYAEGGNLMMIPASPSGLVSRPKKFFIARGGGAVAAGTGEVESTGWCYSRFGSLPTVFDLVLYPFRGRTAPKVEVRPLVSTPEVTALAVSAGPATDYVIISRAGRKEVQAGDITVEGETAVLRTREGIPVRLSGANLKRLVYVGKTVFESETPEDQVDRVLR